MYSMERSESFDFWSSIITRMRRLTKGLWVKYVPLWMYSEMSKRALLEMASVELSKNLSPSASMNAKLK
jgi:hypothetical protein